MRGPTFSSYALVAFALSAYAAPLEVRTDDLLEARQPEFSAGKVGIVAVGQDFEKRAASTTAKPAAGASSKPVPSAAGGASPATSKPAAGGAKPTPPAAGGAPADLPAW